MNRWSEETHAPCQLGHGRSRRRRGAVSGKATLTGEVDTGFESSAAQMNALETGAIAVDNRLAVP
jgi:hypothetical protein